MLYSVSDAKPATSSYRWEDRVLLRISKSSTGLTSGIQKDY